MRVCSRTIVLVILVVAAILSMSACPGCAQLPETATKIRIGESEAIFPKSQEIGEGLFEAHRPDGSWAKLSIKNAKSDAQPALDAYVQAQARQMEVVAELVKKIPQPKDLVPALIPK